MSLFQDAIDEVTEAADKLAGDSYGGESRSAALQVALQVWLCCEHQKQQTQLAEQVRSQQEAQRQFFGGPIVRPLE